MTQTNSRFITHPDTVYPDGNHSVVLVDASTDDIENIGYFCKVSNKNYDIYLYRGDLGDLQWLSAITNLADQVLVNETSLVTITPPERLTKFGSSQQLEDPLAYFQNFDELAD